MLQVGTGYLYFFNSKATTLELRILAGAHSE